VIEADEMWSFVGKKLVQVWVWGALDAETRAMVAMVTGDRSEATARALFAALPEAYRREAIFLTDFWPAYRAALPDGRHGECAKRDGLTNHIERFWCTLRQRCARFVRKTLSFSKCPRNHVGALWFFIRLYNESRL
jgi:insertion element IS1 protein InsB